MCTDTVKLLTGGRLMIAFIFFITSRFCFCYYCVSRNIYVIYKTVPSSLRTFLYILLVGGTNHSPIYSNGLLYNVLV